MATLQQQLTPTVGPAQQRYVIPLVNSEIANNYIAKPIGGAYDYVSQGVTTGWNAITPKGGWSDWAWGTKGTPNTIGKDGTVVKGTAGRQGNLLPLVNTGIGIGNAVINYDNLQETKRHNKTVEQQGINDYNALATQVNNDINRSNTIASSLASTMGTKDRYAGVERNKVIKL